MESYEKNKVLTLLYRIFQAEEYQWAINEVMVVPTFDEISKTVEELEGSAYEVKGMAESGRIRVQYDKELHTYEYYLNLGTN